MCQSLSALLWVEELTAFRLHFNHSVKQQYLHHLTQGEFTIRIQIPHSVQEQHFHDMTEGLRTFLPHFGAGVSHVHVYACLRKAYGLTSHNQGA